MRNYPIRKLATASAILYELMLLSLTYRIGGMLLQVPLCCGFYALGVYFARSNLLGGLPLKGKQVHTMQVLCYLRLVAAFLLLPKYLPILGPFSVIPVNIFQTLLRLVEPLDPPYLM